MLFSWQILYNSLYGELFPPHLLSFVAIVK